MLKSFINFLFSVIYFILFCLAFTSAWGNSGYIETELLQRNLKLLGYNPGPIDGLRGNKTNKSYQEFLTQNKLEYSENAKFDLNLVLKKRIEKIVSSMKEDPELTQLVDVQDASHLLRRSGFGAHPSEIERILNISKADAIGVILLGYLNDDILKLPKFTEKDLPPYFMRYDGFNDERAVEIAQLKDWWLSQMINTSTPQIEKLILLWHNHFTSGFEDTNNNSHAILKQHMLFRKFGFSNFKLLTKMMLSDVAMLSYLDNDRNSKDNPNENFARELLELFTLGEGQYDEVIVKEAARSLTGYSYNKINQQAWFAARKHDYGSKKLFGNEGKFNGYDLIDIIFEQPTASQFITNKFWRNYISELVPPDADEFQKISKKIRESDFDILTLLAEIFASTSFWSDNNRGTIIKSPVSLAVGTVRSTGYVPIAASNFSERLARLGQEVFEPPNVAGWPGAADWISSTRILGREKLMKDIVISLRATDQVKSEDMTSINQNTVIKELDTSQLSKERALAAKKIHEYTAEKKINDKQKKIQPVHIRFSPPEHKNTRIESWATIFTATKKIGFHVNIQPEDGNEFVICLSAPETINSFAPELAEWENQSSYGMCFSSDAEPDEFRHLVKVIATMDSDDKRRVELICKSLGVDKQIVDYVADYTDPVHAAKQISKTTSFCQNALDTVSGENASKDQQDPNIVPRMEDQLIIDKVRFSWVPKISNQKEHRQFSLSLSKIKFNKLEKQGMVLHFGSSPRSNSSGRKLTLRMYEDKCDVNCLTLPYKNDHFMKNRKMWMGHFSLKPKRNGDFNQIDEFDKKFVSALWLALPELINRALISDEKQKFHSQLKAWEEDLKVTNRHLPRSKFNKMLPNFRLKILEAEHQKTKKVNMMMDITDVNNKIEANEAAKIENLKELNSSIENLGLSNSLHEVFLSVPPVASAALSKDITELLLDPAYQLE